MNKQKQLWFKLATIFGLMILLQVPLLWVDGAMRERSSYQNQAASEIARSWSHAQTLTGPFLVVPYKVRFEEQVWDKNLEAYVTRERIEDHRKFIMPSNSSIKGDVSAERRSRGIYSTPVYRSMLDIQGDIDLAEYHEIKTYSNFVSMGQVYIVAFLGDLRGVSQIPELSYGDKRARFAEGTKLNYSHPGIHAKLDIEAETHIPFKFSLDLKGSNALGFYPVGKNNIVSINSDWQHPKFRGIFLPDSRSVSESGFNVEWKLNSLSSNLSELVDACERGDCSSLLNTEFGIDFIEPISSYSLADRAGKYALLFLVITFASFFLFEIFKRLLIHPLQYLFVGLALSVFYLLLVALSEHISFSLAYWVSALSCIGLIGVYTSYVLAGKMRALGLSAALILVYSCMFVILNSEDFAFLMGAILMFTLLGSIMLLTRKVNWYELSAQGEKLNQQEA